MDALLQQVIEQMQALRADAAELFHLGFDR